MPNLFDAIFAPWHPRSVAIIQKFFDQSKYQYSPIEQNQFLLVVLKFQAGSRQRYPIANKQADAICQIFPPLSLRFLFLDEFYQLNVALHQLAKNLLL
jgi:hypothetical protein